jgi:PAS domain S-box-containing protein
MDNKIQNNIPISLEIFKSAVDQASDHIIITNSNGIIVYANKSVGKTTGYTSEEIIGNTPKLWGQQMDILFYHTLWNTISNKKKHYYGQLINKRKNGEIYDAEIHISPILDTNGNIIFYIGIEQDITKQKAVDKMKSEFISLAAHQLRTPLTAIKWQLELALENSKEVISESQKIRLMKIADSNERMISLVDALLTVSHLETGSIVITPIKMQINPIIEQCIEECKNKYHNRHHDIQYVIDSLIPEVPLDKILFEQIVQNFLTNAIKYSLPNTHIDIHVVLENNDQIKIIIKDNGFGIPEKQKELIFSRFFRADNSKLIETDGTGLGLYLSKKIVEAYGGTIGFESIENKGSTFWFTVPVTGMKPKEGDKGIA